MKTLQIMGTGCLKCQTLTERVEAAAKELGLECQIEKVTDLEHMIGLGVMMTPALAVDGKLKVSGKVPSVDEIKKLLT